MNKVCGDCHKKLPLSAFNRNASRDDGRDHACRECRRKFNLLHCDNWPKYRAVRKASGGYRASFILNNTIRSGEIVKPEICSCCGTKAKLDGHHDDYSKPLDVAWLCRLCHKREYGKALLETTALEADG